MCLGSMKGEMISCRLVGKKYIRSCEMVPLSKAFFKGSRGKISLHRFSCIRKIALSGRPFGLSELSEHVLARRVGIAQCLFQLRS